MTEPVSVIRWEKPPPTSMHGERRTAPWSRYNDLADELRAAPGRWAVIAEWDGSQRTELATHVRMGSIACFTPAGDFDAVSRQVLGKTVIYARYLGDTEEPHA